jgi:hypothetical protein
MDSNSERSMTNDIEQLRTDLEQLRTDLEKLIQFRRELNNNLYYFTNPMTGGMCRGSEHLVKSLKELIIQCDARIKLISAVLLQKIQSITIPLIRKIAEDICSVQPMTKEVIGDPTRGWENVYTVFHWSVRYEVRQEMTWEDDGGYAL